MRCDRKISKKSIKMAEENIIRDTLFECFVNHMLSNKNWYGYVLKKIHHLRSTNNLNVDLEEFLGIIIHSNGHGEYVSQKTRNAIVQIMAPDRHTNTVDIEEFEFIMKYHVKNGMLNSTDSTDTKVLIGPTKVICETTLLKKR